jgi:hypothetical protein
MENKLISIIKFIHENLIFDAIKSVQEDTFVPEKNKQFPILSSFNLTNINNISLICRNKLFMKKYYDESTSDTNKHGRTLGNEFELLGSYILSCYELNLYIPNEDEQNEEDFKYISNSNIIDDKTQNLINLYSNLYKTINRCNEYKMPLGDCCLTLKDQYDKISCKFKIPFFSWLMSFFSFKSYKNKYLKYKKKYIKLKLIK